MKKFVCCRIQLFLFALLSSSAAFALVHEHVILDSVSLDGAWEMAYSPYEHLPLGVPKFVGVKVENAIPGYWEDLLGEFRRAGMTGEFRFNPWYERQTFPIWGNTRDTTLPDGVYGCFFYRRTGLTNLKLSPTPERRFAYCGATPSIRELDLN